MLEPTFVAMAMTSSDMARQNAGCQSGQFLKTSSNHWDFAVCSLYTPEALGGNGILFPVVLPRNMKSKISDLVVRTNDTILNVKINSAVMSYSRAVNRPYRSSFAPRLVPWKCVSISVSIILMNTWTFSMRITVGAHWHRDLPDNSCHIFIPPTPKSGIESRH